MADETPVQQRRVKATTLRQILIGGGGTLGALLIIGLVWYAWSSYSESSANRAQAARLASVTDLAQQLGGELTPTFETIEAMSKSDAVARALAGEASAHPAVKSQGSGIAGLLNLRLLAAGHKELDNTGNPPLQYGSLDMLRRAEAADAPVEAEVHLFGSPDQHMVVVRQVKDSAAQPLGFVHASLDVAQLQLALDSLNTKGIYVELQQPLKIGGPKVIARSAGVRPEEINPATHSVAGTVLQLAYWRKSGIASGGGGGPGLVLGVAVLIVIAVGGGLFMIKRGSSLSGAISTGSPGEVVIYQGAVLAIVQGTHPGLERLVPGLSNVNIPAAARASQAIPVDDYLEGDDITTIASAPAKPAPNVDSDRTEPQPHGGDESTPIAKPAKPQAESAPPAAPEEPAPVTVPADIFRAYDIRGVVGEGLTAEGVYEIGRAIGSEAYDRGQQGLVVARDGRDSSPALSEALIKGLRDVGRNVIDIGLAPTPVLYFATHYLDTQSGVMVTGSHNPGEYNGLKIVLDGEALSGDAINAIRVRIEAGDYANGAGTVQTAEMVPQYIRRISEEIPVALGNAFKIVVDCGNGVPGAVAPQLLRALGHDVVELYCEVDGSFPNHHPDPSQPENLTDLIDMVNLENADFGLAFDGDGDRLGVVDSAGNIIWPDRQMILFVKDVLSRNAGAEIIFDVKCSRHLTQAIEANGGKPVMWKTGHSFIKSKMKEIHAPLAGEMSGHIFFKERWYGFDDALYAAARLVEILLDDGRAPVEIFAELPESASTPELRIDMPEDKHAAFMEQLIGTASFDGGEASTIDGLRVDFPDSWGLIRPSNTTPYLVLRFEGDDDAALNGVQEKFRTVLLGIDSGLDLPF